MINIQQQGVLITLQLF